MRSQWFASVDPPEDELRVPWSNSTAHADAMGVVTALGQEPVGKVELLLSANMVTQPLSFHRAVVVSHENMLVSVFGPIAPTLARRLAALSVELQRLSVKA